MTDPKRPEPDNEEQVDREPLVQYEDLEQATGFTQVNNAVLRCYPELSDGEKLTYAVLKSFAYVGPETFVGQETLARARNITVSTVSRHLTRLIELGLVSVRRRGQGKTNIWILNRIPREKLEHYLAEWRPNLTLNAPPTQDSQTKTSQNPQIKDPQDSQTKTSHDPQAEEEQCEEDKPKNNGRGTRPDDASLSPSRDSSTTTSARDKPSYSRAGEIVENSGGKGRKLSTIGENVENLDELAEVVAESFDVPDQRQSILGFLRKHDAEIGARAFNAVIARLEEGAPIRKPVAYFYAVVKVMQAEREVESVERRRDEEQKRTIAVSWASHLQNDWPDNQVRAILMDTYHSEDFVDEVMNELAGEDG